MLLLSPYHSFLTRDTTFNLKFCSRFPPGNKSIEAIGGNRGQKNMSSLF